MMDATELRDFIREHFTRTAFRLEALQQYDPTVPDFRRYLDGEASPNKQAWIDRLRSDRDRGLYRHRVRIVTAPVTDYTRYECEWGYAPNAAAGEDIRILDLTDRNLPTVGYGDEDFWLLDDEHALSMHYDSDGKFVSADLEPSMVNIWRNMRDTLWLAAEPFEPWWERRTDLHRGQRRVA